jgi:hypothetical protein
VLLLMVHLLQVSASAFAVLLLSCSLYGHVVLIALCSTVLHHICVVFLHERVYTRLMCKPL